MSTRAVNLLDVTPLRRHFDLATRFVVVLFLIGVMFPFLSVMPALGSDTQPIAIGAGAILLAGARRLDFPTPVTLLGFVALLATVLLPFSGLSFAALRNWSNYVGVFIIAAVSWVVARTDRKILADALWVGIIVWFVIGLVQTFGQKDFMNFVLPAARTSETRGGVGLAPEATMYGLQCLLFMLAALVLFTGRRLTIALILCTVQIVGFARSSMSLLLLVMWGGFLLVARLRSPRGWLLAIVAGGAVVVGLQLLASGRIPGLEDARIGTLTRMMLDNPQLVFVVDQSGAERMSSVTYAMAGFVLDTGLPHGFSTWDAYASGIAPRFLSIFPVIPGGYRPMSGYGSAFFELGFVALLIPLACTLAFVRRHGDVRALSWPSIMAFHLILFTSVPLATPTVGFLVGLAAAGTVRREGSLS